LRFFTFVLTVLYCIRQVGIQSVIGSYHTWFFVKNVW